MFTFVSHHKKNTGTLPADVQVAFHKTAAGILKISYTSKGIIQAGFVAEHTGVFIDLDQLPKSLIPQGTPFQTQVWQTLCTIPAGKTVSYEHIARAIGKPTAYRAVANAIGKNPIAYFIPCHRVIKKNGDLCGFFWGIEKKAALLKAEEFQK